MKLKTKQDLLDLGIWISEDMYELEIMEGTTAVLYPVSIRDNKRKIRRLCTPHISYNKNGLRKMYMIYKFHGGKITISAARLFYIWFIGDVEDGWDIDHIDNDSLNNNINNLQYITHADNLKKKLTDMHCKHSNNCWLRNLDIKEFKEYCKLFSKNI